MTTNTATINRADVLRARYDELRLAHRFTGRPWSLEDREEIKTVVAELAELNAAAS